MRLVSRPSALVPGDVTRCVSSRNRPDVGSASSTAGSDVGRRELSIMVPPDLNGWTRSRRD